MQLFPMRTFPASGNGLSCLGPVFRPITDSDQHSFPIFLCHIGVRTLSCKHKVIKVSPKYLSELIVSALKTDKNVAQSKSNDVHSYPGYEYESGRVSTIRTVI